MNNKKALVIITFVLIAGLLSGCTAGVGMASSWPGISSDGDRGYFAYGSEIFAIDAKNGSLDLAIILQVLTRKLNSLLRLQFLKTRSLRAVTTTPWLPLIKTTVSEKWTFASRQRPLHCLAFSYG